MQKCDLASAYDTWDYLTAKTTESGTCHWLDENDKLHRANGPAVIRADGTRFWIKHGKYHRVDGPAAIWPDGKVEYYLDDECLTEEQFNVRKLTING